MLFYRALLVLLLLIAIPCQAAEMSWHGTLQDGSQIAIDPITNKVTRGWQGETSQLWDGVHQLDNGAVIIVRNGIVVKDQAILNIQQEQETKQLEEACVLLVRKVCGPRDECAGHPACDPARQLLTLEQEEVRDSWSNVTPESSKQCMEAMHDETFFKVCRKRNAGDPLSSCENLQRRVCGETNQCVSSDACNVAGQLLKMEVEDRYAAPGDFAYASKQCSDVLNDTGFFRPCK